MRGGQLTVRAAAVSYGLGWSSLQAAIRDGRIRHASAGRKPKGGTWYRLDEQQLVEDLARLPRCLASGCQAPSLRTDGYCETHVGGLHTLSDLARRHGQNAAAARRAVDLGQIRCADRAKTRILVAEGDYLDDVANLPLCAEEGCERQVSLGSLRCNEHHAAVGLERIARSRRDRRQARRLTVNAAATKYGFSGRGLADAVRDGLIRHASAAVKGRRVMYELNEDELVEDLAQLPRCLAENCDAPSLRVDGYCQAHAEDLEFLHRVAVRHGHDPKAARRAVDLGQIRCADPTKTRILVAEGDYLEDVANLPLCAEEECERRVILGSARCRDHYNAPGRERVRRNRARRDREDRDWLTVAEFARLAGVSPPKVYQDVAAGRLPAERVPRPVRVPLSELAAYRLRHRGRSGKRPDAVELAARRSRVLELHRQGRSPDDIAKAEGIVRSAVCRHLDAAGVERPRRRPTRQLTAEERVEQAAEARRLAALGFAVEEIAAKLDVSITQTNLYLRERRVGVESDPRCETCGEPIIRRPYAPRDPTFAQPRFCSSQCERDAAVAAYRAALGEKGLLSPPEFAIQLGVSPGRVYELLSEGLVTGERVQYAGMIRPGWGIALSEVRRFDRAWLRGMNGTRALWLDPDRAVAQLRRMGHVDRLASKLGITALEAEAVFRTRIKSRAQRINRRRAGRKPRTDDALRWLEMSEAIQADLLESWKRDRQLGLAADATPPSQREACRAVALEDWQANESSWPRAEWPPSGGDADALDPAHESRAGDRVRKAIKRLQSAGTKISAT